MASLFWVKQKNEDSKLLLRKTNISTDIDYDSVYKRMEPKRAESENTLRERTDLLNQIKRKYAYEENQKEEMNRQLKAGRTWFEIICARNNITLENSELRAIQSLQEYFSFLRSNSQYVLILSCADECSNYRNKLVEISGLPLRRDVSWRDSYVAVIDGGEVKIDEKSREELNTEFTFVAGHPNCSMEYKDGHLKVDCMTMKYAKIRIKSKGYTDPMGAFKSEIIVDNIDYSMNRTGINMVVIDKETGEVVDSVNVNTYNAPELKINRR